MQGNEQLLGELAKIDPRKPFGTALFDALAKVTVTPAVEAVCLRLQHYLPEIDAPRSLEVQVYLIQRSPDDTAYHGEWHCPGSVLRPGEDIEDVFARLQKKEFNPSAVHFGRRQFVANVNHPTEARGHFLSLVYLCELVDDVAASWDTSSLRGKWFPVDNLPEKTVETHRVRIIPAALGAFVAENTKICD